MKKKLTKKEKVYIEKLEEYIKSAEQRKKYAIERLDILLISLSSGGLAMTLSIYSKYENLSLYSIKVSWVAFSLALIINLSSQWTGYFANKYDIDCTKKIIEEEKGEVVVGTHVRFSNKSTTFTKWTNNLNGAAFGSLTIAIVAVVIFIISKY